MTRRASVKVALAALLGLAAACSPNPNGLGVADFGGLQGRVIDGRTAQPIRTATVSIGGKVQQVNPSANGVFTFGVNEVPVGNQPLTVSSPGYATATVSVTIRKGETLNLPDPIALAATGP